MSRLPDPLVVAGASSAPRTWTRLRPVADAQRSTSRRLIGEIASKAPQGGRAIVLGAGRCDEIPLDLLVERFFEVRLVDADRAALDEGLRAAALSVEAANRVTLEIADLTGLTDTLLERAKFLANEAPSFDAWLERVIELTTELRPWPLTLGDGLPSAVTPRFDLVVASCVLCQLHVSAQVCMSALVAQRFTRAEADQFHQSPRWSEALAMLAERMERTFVDSLAKLVAPEGRIYLSDTVQVCFVQGTREGDWATDGTYRMTRTTDLADYLDERFAIERLGEWPWVFRSPAKPGDTGRVYRVQGLLLTLADTR